jgi:hypothetical protein
MSLHFGQSFETFEIGFGANRSAYQGGTVLWTVGIKLGFWQFAYTHSFEKAGIQ